MGKTIKNPNLPITELGLEGLYGPSAHFQKRIAAEAEIEGLTPLSTDHWCVIQYVLDYYWSCHQVPPPVPLPGPAIFCTTHFQFENRSFVDFEIGSESVGGS